MDFSVNFMNRASVVLNEAFKLKKYKAMPLALAIIVGILMLPIALASVGCAVVLYVFGYLFSVVSLPVQRLHKLLREEGQSVQHATQFIVYFISWGFIFSTYALLSFFLIMLTILYSVFSILTYIWTLGGFKFHVFAADEDISIEVEGKYNTLIPVIFIAGMGVLLLLVPAINAIASIIKYEVPFTMELFSQLFKIEFYALSSWRILFSVIYSAVAFAPNPKKIEK